MYEFAVVALIGLAVYKIADLIAETGTGAARYRTLVTFALALGAVVALDHSLFTGFGVEVREEWIGTVFTGLVVGALAAVWQAVLGFLGSGESAPERRRTDRPRIAA